MNPEKELNSHFSHIVNKPYLLSVIRLLGQGHYPKQIADALSKHPQEVTRTIQHLERDGIIICKNPGGRPKFYTVDTSFSQFLTRCGKRINHPSTTDLTRVHNVALRFPVFSGLKIRIGRNNNGRPPKQYLKDFYGCTVEKTTKNLIFYCNSVKRGDPFEAYNESIQDINFAVHKFLERFPGFKLGKGVMCRKPHIATNINDPLGKAIQEVVELSHDIGKIDDSEGTGGEIDFFTPQAAADYMNLPGRVKGIDNKIESMRKALADHTSDTSQRQGEWTRAVEQLTEVAKGGLSFNQRQDRLNEVFTSMFARLTKENTALKRLVAELSAKKKIRNAKKMGRRRMWPPH